MSEKYAKEVDLKEKMIELGARLMDEKTSANALASLVTDVFFWMDLCKEFEKTKTGELTRDEFFALVLVSNLVDELDKNIFFVDDGMMMLDEEKEPIASKLFGDFSKNLGIFVLGCFKSGVLSIDPLKYATENYFSVVRELNQTELSKISSDPSTVKQK